MRTATLTLILILTATCAQAETPSPQEYQEALLDRARDTLTNLPHRPRSFVSLSRARWRAIDDAQELLDWFRTTQSATRMSHLLEVAREQTRSRLLDGVPPEEQQTFLAPLAPLEASAFKQALEGTLAEACATYDSGVDYRSIYLSPSTDSPQVARVPQRHYVTYLDRADPDWILVRFDTGSRAVRGYMQTSPTLQVFAAPPPPPAWLAQRLPSDLDAAQKHYLSVLRWAAAGQLDTLPHEARSEAFALREDLAAIDHVDDLLGFLGSDQAAVRARLLQARREARVLTTLPDAALAELSTAEASTLRTALLASGSLGTATYDSGADYRELYVEPDTQSRLRTLVRQGSHLTLLDEGHPDFVKVRWFDVDVAVEGYMERTVTLLVFAAPDSQGEADAGEPGRGLVDALLGTSSTERR